MQDEQLLGNTMNTLDWNFQPNRKSERWEMGERGIWQRSRRAQDVLNVHGNEANYELVCSGARACSAGCWAVGVGAAFDGSGAESAGCGVLVGGGA